MKTLRKDSAEWAAIQEADRAYFRQVIADMNLRPGISIGSMPERSSFNSWGCEQRPRWEIRL